MALKLKPPTHRADAGGIFIHEDDAAWDLDLYKADLDALIASAAKAAKDAAEAAYRAKTPDATAEDIDALRASCEPSMAERHAALARHPVVRYFAGLTRWQPNAEDWDPERKPCTVRDRYLTKGKACEFTIRRLRSEVYQAANEIVSTGARLTEFARLGLKAISSPDWNWSLPEGATRAPPEVIEALHESDPGLLLEIGKAVISLCAPLREAETFRSA